MPRLDFTCMHNFCITGTLPEDVARFVFQQLVVAVDFIHKKGKVNRDIKLANVRLHAVLVQVLKQQQQEQQQQQQQQNPFTTSHKASSHPPKQHACAHSMLVACKYCSCTVLACIAPSSNAPNCCCLLAWAGACGGQWHAAPRQDV